jgi:predicted NBD/HSP70 family sugar kinase
MVKKVYCDERSELSTYVSGSRLRITMKRWNGDTELHLSLFPTDLKELINDLQKSLITITTIADASTQNFAKVSLQKELEDAFGQVYIIDKDGKAVRKDEC